MVEIDTKGMEIFFLECGDLLKEVEASLLAVEEDVHDPTAINTVFRGYHTIKGGSAMFGLSELTEYAHHVESLLSGMRDGMVSVEPIVISALLESLDCLKMFLAHYRDDESLDRRVVDTSVKKIKGFGIGGVSASASNVSPSDPPSKASKFERTDSRRPQPSPPSTDTNHFLIRLSFQQEMFRNGSDPMALLEDIGELGRAITVAHAHLVPSLEQFDPYQLYLKWTIKLETEKTKEELEDVLMFFQDQHETVIEDITKPPVETRQKSLLNLPSAESEPNHPASPETDIRPSVPTTERQNTLADGSTVQKSIDQLSAPDRVVPPTSARKPAKQKRSGTIRVAIDKLDLLVNLVGEAVINQTRFVKLFEKVSDLDDRLGETALQLIDDNDFVVREIQDQVMNIRMVPIQRSFSPLQRMVRDYTVESGKRIQLEIHGGETELDKTLTEKISGPLKHLVRNAMDHGIEMPDTREAAGKNPVGSISLEAYQKEGHIIIEISDNGKGIDTDRILEIGIQKGLISAGKKPDRQEIFQLLFNPGFSTAEKVTDVSGRGVGMDVVKQNIEALHGSVGIESTVGLGSQFRIRLPLTLAIIEGMLLNVGQEMFTIPLLAITESLQPHPSQVKTIKNRQEIVDVRGEYIPLIRLHQLFNLKAEAVDPSEGLVIIVEDSGRKYGFLVDNMLEQQQIVIKSLEDNFVQLPGLAGATILGDGRVSLILDVPGLINHHLGRLTSE
ncbi:MAG: chemotaxis protein CheA [Proteobacteria bacterium]|nr:chemotaxis protein CheA [Pseudomonadota bacterium]